MNLGAIRLRAVLDERNCTPYSASRTLGMDATHFGRLLTGARKPGRSLAAMLATIFGVDTALWDQVAPESTVATTSAPAKRRARAASKVLSRRARAGGRPSQASEAGR